MACSPRCGPHSSRPVSYTHLDVYKRQAGSWAPARPRLSLIHI
ncbi:hypothetical protein [Streptomyces fragilis]